MAPGTVWLLMGAERPSSRSARARALLATVRFQATLGAVAVVGLTLLLGSIALVSGLRETLVGDRREVAESRADEVSSSIHVTSKILPLVVIDDEDELIQVVDADGVVIGSSANVAGRPPVAQLQPGESAEAHVANFEGVDFVAVAAAAAGPGGPLTVIVARGLTDVTESTEVLTHLLAVALPALLTVIAVTTWAVVRRALIPVESIRAEVDEISAAGLHRRVPQPGGHDEIASLASTMNRMLGRLEDSQTRQRRFVSDASHELRSPVASIRQHAEVALAHPDRVTVEELAETVLAEDLRVQALVDDLLLLARFDEGTLTRSHQAVDLDDLVFDEARRLRDTTPLQVVTSEVSAGRVRGESVQLGRLVRNLADNAARHARSRVSFALSEPDGGSVLLRVDDDGGGIAANERRRIFERFVRLDDARARDDGGSGLGLAIVAEVAAHHGGTVRATDAPGGGARLEVRLPRSAD